MLLFLEFHIYYLIYCNFLLKFTNFIIIGYILSSIINFMNSKEYNINVYYM
jgi:hypothetical protein